MENEKCVKNGGVGGGLVYPVDDGLAGMKGQGFCGKNSRFETGV